MTCVESIARMGWVMASQDGPLWASVRLDPALQRALRYPDFQPDPWVWWIIGCIGQKTLAYWAIIEMGGGGESWMDDCRSVDCFYTFSDVMLWTCFLRLYAPLSPFSWGLLNFCQDDGAVGGGSLLTGGGNIYPSEFGAEVLNQCGCSLRGMLDLWDLAFNAAVNHLAQGLHINIYTLDLKLESDGNVPFLLSLIVLRYFGLRCLR